jgi:hypothetical protein
MVLSTRGRIDADRSRPARSLLVFVRTGHESASRGCDRLARNAIVASIESGERQSWKRGDGCPVGADQVCRDSM